jgi:hypothetical chaperone protein
VTFGEIIGLFIGHLKQAAEAQIGAEINAVVIGRPVFFVDGDPEADRAAQAALEAAARAHRFSHVEFQFEPVAAALDYEQTCQSEELALVIDAGGGTSDFSLVRVSPEGAAKSSRDSDVLASHGVHIGGTDFDRALNLRAAMPTLGHGSLISSAFGLDQVRSAPAHHFAELATWHRINLQYAPKNLAMSGRSSARRTSQGRLKSFWMSLSKGAVMKSPWRWRRRKFTSRMPKFLRSGCLWTGSRSLSQSAGMICVNPLRG